jgi:hypothetical protein
MKIERERERDFAIIFPPYFFMTFEKFYYHLAVQASRRHPDGSA